MTEIIELFKKEEKKQKAIEFMKSLIKDLEKDKLDPEKVIIFLKWKVDEETESFEFYENINTTENILGMIELMRNKIIHDYLVQ